METLNIIKMNQLTRLPTTIEEQVTHLNGEQSTLKYSKGRLLGRGGFARVFEVHCTEPKKTFACKVIQKSSLTKPRARQKLMSEIKIHKSLKHPNLVRFDHFFEDPECVYILLELCTNQTLSEMLRRRKRITELEAQCYLYQILLGVQYFHSRRVIHRDIKLANVFLGESMEVKIGDFGLAAKLEFASEKKRTICGTPNYIAPEILEGKQGHSYEVDVWSLGVLLYTLLVGKPPFQAEDAKTTYRRIKMNAYSFPQQISLSSEVKGLISQILVSDPGKRLTVAGALEHRFFCGHFPRSLPSSVLAVPPTSNFCSQFQMSVQISSPRQSDCSSPTSPKAMNSPKVQAASRRVVVISAYLPSASEGPTIWVKKWVDYSTKYGLGYILSNNSVGVYFNDSTKIVSSPNGERILYIQRTANSRHEESREYRLSDYPKELAKKVTLLEHFRKNLSQTDPIGCSENQIYIKKYLITSHAFIFRLNNKTMQVAFQDRTELILCGRGNHVTYVNKQNENLTFPLRVALESGTPDMVKRLKYTREILSKMVADGDSHK